MTIRYCTPEWLEESGKRYSTSDHFEKALSKVTTKIFFRIKADPSWGIDKDFIFGADVDAGKLLDLGYYSEEKTKERAELILSATPQIWKGILRKDTKFISEFMLGRVTLEAGSRVELLKITPYANHFVDALTQFEIQFPDEMTEEELEAYRVDLTELREAAGL
jgi:putative sterol carrier protein